MIGLWFSLRWEFRHRIEVRVVALETDYIVCDSDHRCGFSCDIGKMLSGEMHYRYADFEILFEPMAVDAIALPGVLR